jgi:beta-fructofuranosidase
MQKDAEKFSYLSNGLGQEKMGGQKLPEISRRSFLKQSAVLGAGAWTTIYGISPAFAGQDVKDDTSKIPHYKFAGTLREQLQQLENNPLMKSFAKSREKLASLPYRPIYHFASPQGALHDPNGLCFWNGRWHLFYQMIPIDDPHIYWGHTFSEDLIHWHDLPYAIYPGPEANCYSGATLVEDNRVIAMYHGNKLGNMVAISEDPLLLNWEKLTGKAVIPFYNPDGSKATFPIFDPCIWKKDGIYYSLSGGMQKCDNIDGRIRADYLSRSKDLKTWQYLHPFVEGDRFTRVGDDGACPYFWPIGDRHILLFYSHRSGGQYLLGDYDKKRNKFVATSHGEFNFRGSLPSGVHAPSATPSPDGKGDVIVIFNMNAGKGPDMDIEGSNELMSLPRRLTLVERDKVKIEPAGEIESLRYGHQHIERMELPANQEVVLESIKGNAMEIIVEIDHRRAPMIEMNVLRSPNKEEFTRIAYYWKRGYRNPDKNKGKITECVITLDSSYSSTLPDVRQRAPETVGFLTEDDEPLKLRVFIDKSVVEIFINDGKQCLAVRAYPGRKDSTGISLRSQGRSALVKSLDIWQMKNIYS